MTAASEDVLRARLAELEAENRRLRDEADGVAAANVHAAMQLLELSEARQRELEAKTTAVEQALHAAQAASRQKSRFLANISHELRTPISGIVGMAELLLGSPLGAGQREFSEAIARTADDFLALINQLLDFTKIEAGCMELESIEFDLWSAVESVAQLLQLRCDQKGIELRFRISPDVPRHVVGDPLRVRQVLTNLGGNAVKFTDRGHVGIDVRTADGGATLCIEVADTGCGIDEASAARLFVPFVQADASTTRRYGGTGLGLAITHDLVTRMGGTLRVCSTPGAGATFTATVPITGAVPARAVGEVGSRAVVVGHDLGADAVEFLRQHLPRLGLELGSTAAPDALAVVESRGGAVAELAHRCRAVAAGAPIVAVLPAGAVVADEDLRALGVVAVLRRPLRPSLLEAAFAGADPDPAADGAAAPDFTGMRVLVAEDTAISRTVVCTQLRRMGVEVEVVEDGRGAVERTAATPFDLVLMDCQMPVLDGFGATASIREREAASAGGRRTPIVALTANAMSEDRERCLAAGMDDHLAKPVRRDALADLLRRWRRPEGAVAQAGS